MTSSDSFSPSTSEELCLEAIELEDTGYIWFSVLDNILVDSRIKDFLRKNNLKRIKLRLEVVS